MKKTLLLLSPLAALTLAACATTATNSGPPIAASPTVLDAWTDRVQVTPIPDEILLAAHATGLSGAQARALSDFQARWMQAEGGLIVISAPNQGGYKVGSEARDMLLGLGVRSDQVRLSGYDAAKPGAPVIVGFQRYVVATPNCSSWPDVRKSFGNEPLDNFGCSVTANMAAQVANPRDLLESRPLDPADPLRRADVLGKYRTGANTAGQARASGTVSQAIQ